MTRVVLAMGLSLLSTAAFAQAVDCSAFEHKKDGSWVVTKETRLAGLKNGVATSIGLAPGQSFAHDGQTSMGGVDVLKQVEAACQ